MRWQLVGEYIEYSQTFVEPDSVEYGHFVFYNECFKQEESLFATLPVEYYCVFNDNIAEGCDIVYVTFEVFENSTVLVC